MKNEEVTHLLDSAVGTAEPDYRLLIENAIHITAVLDQYAIIRYVSPAIERMLGHSPERLRGTSAFDLIHSEDAPALRERLPYRVQHTGVGEFVEFRARHRDGSWRVLEAIATNRLEDPKVAGLAVDARDITERKWTAERLQNSFDSILAVQDVGRALSSRFETWGAVFIHPRCSYRRDRGEHVGLASMQERVTMLRGHYAVRSRPGAGTRVIVEIPLR